MCCAKYENALLNFGQHDLKILSNAKANCDEMPFVLAGCSRRAEFQDRLFLVYPESSFDSPGVSVDKLTDKLLESEALLIHTY